MLGQQGYIRFRSETAERLEVIQDRLQLTPDNQSRALEALEAALDHGHGHLRIYPLDADRNPGPPWHFSSHLHCPDCDLHYREPTQNLFSFNSPMGACDACRGFGRSIGIDWSLVVPDQSKSLLDGAVKPIQSDSYSEVQEDLIGLCPAARRADGCALARFIGCGPRLGDRRRGRMGRTGSEAAGLVWHTPLFSLAGGTKFTKCHVRVLLSRYRSYDLCPACHGARLADEALDWRIGTHELADAALPRDKRFRHARTAMSQTAWYGLPGLGLHDLMRLPIVSLSCFFRSAQTVQ